jgi:chromatin structure-remodeling complex protein RSC7
MDSSFPNPGYGAEKTMLSNIPPDILDELPASCRTAFEEAGERELEWRSKWLNESIDGHRAAILSSVEWYPK